MDILGHEQIERNVQQDSQQQNIQEQNEQQHDIQNQYIQQNIQNQNVEEQNNRQQNMQEQRNEQVQEQVIPVIQLDRASEVRAVVNPIQAEPQRAQARSSSKFGRHRRAQQSQVQQPREAQRIKRELSPESAHIQQQRILDVERSIGSIPLRKDFRPVLGAQLAPSTGGHLSREEQFRSQRASVEAHELAKRKNIVDYLRKTEGEIADRDWAHKKLLMHETKLAEQKLRANVAAYNIRNQNEQDTGLVTLKYFGELQIAMKYRDYLTCFELDSEKYRSVQKTAEEHELLARELKAQLEGEFGTEQVAEEPVKEQKKEEPVQEQKKEEPVQEQKKEEPVQAQKKEEYSVQLEEKEDASIVKMEQSQESLELQRKFQEEYSQVNNYLESSKEAWASGSPSFYNNQMRGVYSELVRLLDNYCRDQNYTEEQEQALELLEENREMLQRYTTAYEEELKKEQEQLEKDKNDAQSEHLQNEIKANEALFAAHAREEQQHLASLDKDRLFNEAKVEIQVVNEKIKLLNEQMDNELKEFMTDYHCDSPTDNSGALMILNKGNEAVIQILEGFKEHYKGTKEAESVNERITVLQEEQKELSVSIVEAKKAEEQIPADDRIRMSCYAELSHLEREMQKQLEKVRAEEKEKADKAKEAESLRRLTLSDTDRYVLEEHDYIKEQQITEQKENGTYNVIEASAVYKASLSALREMTATYSLLMMTYSHGVNLSLDDEMEKQNFESMMKEHEARIAEQEQLYREALELEEQGENG